MKYLLIALLVVVLVRFLNELARLGRRDAGETVPGGRRRRTPPDDRYRDREVEDAEFEILPPRQPDGDAEES